MRTDMHYSASIFISSVVSKIARKSVRKDIGRELTSHLEDIIEELTNNGVPYEEAVNQAIERMGDPVELGEQLHRTTLSRRLKQIKGKGILLAACSLLLFSYYFYANNSHPMSAVTDHVQSTASKPNMSEVGSTQSHFVSTCPKLNPY